MVRELPARHSASMTTDTHTTTSRELTRSTSRKMLGGVSGGLGAYFSVDPLIFRIGFVITTLATGVGALAYLGFYLLMPTDTGKPAHIGGATQPLAA
jgi:phage shock protein PspC (stress-responsive transcriptional regulator)